MDRQIRIAQQIAGLFKAHAIDVLHDGDAEFAAEGFRECRLAAMQVGTDVRERELALQIVLDVALGEQARTFFIS